MKIPRSLLRVRIHFYLIWGWAKNPNWQMKILLYTNESVFAPDPASLLYQVKPIRMSPMWVGQP